MCILFLPVVSTQEVRKGVYSISYLVLSTGRPPLVRSPGRKGVGGASVLVRMTQHNAHPFPFSVSGSLTFLSFFSSFLSLGLSKRMVYSFICVNSVMKAWYLEWVIEQGEWPARNKVFSMSM